MSTSGEIVIRIRDSAGRFVTQRIPYTVKERSLPPVIPLLSDFLDITGVSGWNSSISSSIFDDDYVIEELTTISGWQIKEPGSVTGWASTVTPFFDYTILDIATNTKGEIRRTVSVDSISGCLPGITDSLTIDFFNAWKSRIDNFSDYVLIDALSGSQGIIQNTTGLDSISGWTNRILDFSDYVVVDGVGGEKAIAQPTAANDINNAWISQVFVTTPVEVLSGWQASVLTLDSFTPITSISGWSSIIVSYESVESASGWQLKEIGSISGWSSTTDQFADYVVIDSISATRLVLQTDPVILSINGWSFIGSGATISGDSVSGWSSRIDNFSDYVFINTIENSQGIVQNSSVLSSVEGWSSTISNFTDYIFINSIEASQMVMQPSVVIQSVSGWG